MLDWDAECAFPSSLEFDFGSTNFEAQTLGPKQGSGLCRDQTILTLTYHVKECGECLLELKETLERQELPWENT